MLKKNQNAPLISIIVATRSREAALAQFLEALRRLPTVPRWELVIADNGSIDGTADLLTAAARNIPLTRIYEPRRGKSRALNSALAVATGELLVFCDDDVVPSRNWLAALYDASLTNPGVNVFGGKIVVHRAKMPRWIIDSYNLHALLLSEQNLGDRPLLFPYGRYPVGPNLAVRRSRLEEKRALWPINLGPGTRIPVGDERAFLVQLSSPSDNDRLYVPTSVVMHCISGRQLSFRKCIARCFFGGLAAGMLMPARHRGCGKYQLGKVVLQRLRQCSSFFELSCMLMRGLGALAGEVRHAPQRFRSSSGNAFRAFERCQRKVEAQESHPSF
jgi:hypothetical protein